MLSEQQALLVTMFSRTAVAAHARRQLIEVFVAYRQGRLIGRTDSDHRWAMLEKRLDQLERLITSQAMVETDEYATAATYAPPVFRLINGNGKVRAQKYSPYWLDHDVRAVMIATHRQMTIRSAVETLTDRFGAERAPSKSALARIWKQLDKTRAAG